MKMETKLTLKEEDSSDGQPATTNGSQSPTPELPSNILK